MTDSSKNGCAARELMNGMRASCSQAILATFGPYMGERGLDVVTCMKLASAFRTRGVDRSSPEAKTKRLGCAAKIINR